MVRKAPSYRLHKPSGRAVVTLNGKDYYLGVHNSKESKLAYARVIGEWSASGTSFGIDENRTTLAILMADYLDFCDVHYPAGPASETTRIQHALRYLDDYIDSLAREFGPLKLKAVRNKMLEEVGAVSKRKHSRTYINKMVDRIRRMFRWATENELVDVSVYTALMTVKGLQLGRTTAPETAAVKPVDDVIVEQTIVYCSPVVADMIRLQRLTGMRPGEICILTPSMIDSSKSVWMANPPRHKTAYRGLERTIYLGPQAQAILQPYMDRESCSPLFSPAEADRARRAKLSEARLTPLNSGNSEGTNRKAKPKRRPGDSYTTQSYGKAVTYACLRAFPFPDGTAEERAFWRAQYYWSPNQLRHTAATEIRKRHGLEAAQVILGHLKSSTTEIYAETDHSRGVEVARSVG